MRLRDALDQTSTVGLRRLAAVHGLPVDGATTRAEVLARVVERLADPVYLAEQVAGLDGPRREALVALRAAGGEARGFLLERAGEGALGALVEQGLVFRAFATAGPRRGEVFAAPEEVLACLPEPAATADDAPVPAAEAPPPAERRATDPVFSVFVLASFLRRSAVDGGPSEAAFAHEVRAWAEEPGGWDWQARWTFLHHLARAAGLFTPDRAGRLVVAPAGARLLGDPPALLDRLWRTYLADREWSELARSEIPRAPDLARGVDASAVRGAVVRAVAGLADGAWARVEDVVDGLRRRAPSFLRELMDARSLALTDPREGTPLLAAPDAWERVEAPLVRGVLLGPLYWLGVLGASADGATVGLTRAGAALLRGGAEVSRTVEPCTWTDDEHLLAPPRADLAALLDAEAYLVLEERGRPSRYRLDGQQLAAALGAGGSLDDLRRLLERLASAEVPPAVAARLSAWAERFGALGLRPAVLLEARSAEELAAVLALPGVRPLVRQTLGPTAAEVAASEVAEVAAALRAAGHLPRVDAALRLMAGRRAYAGLVDEHVLEFLLVSLLALERARPERLADLEGAMGVVERLEGVFPRERLAAIREAAARLAGDLASPPTRRPAGRARAGRARGGSGRTGRARRGQ